MMPVVYHGTPISPRAALQALGPRPFCVSYYRPDDVAPVEAISPAIMYDNGAFSFYTAGRRAGLDVAPERDWGGFYRWLESRLFHPGRWAVIPDVIDAGSQLQDALLADWPFGHRGAPVWHTDEPLDRLARLADQWPRVCFGSSGEHWKVGGPEWCARMDEVWQLLGRRRHRPWVHMLRGVGVAHLYPFDSADSTGLAQSLHRYRQPLFAGTPDEWTGIVAFAERLERRANSRVIHGNSNSRDLSNRDLPRHQRKLGQRADSPPHAGPVTLGEGARVNDLSSRPGGCNALGQ